MNPLPVCFLQEHEHLKPDDEFFERIPAFLYQGTVKIFAIFISLVFNPIRCYVPGSVHLKMKILSH